MSASPFGHASRNADLGLLHETFFVTAVATILCIRTELWLTNYPQLGGHGLHIAHLLYGGLLMLIALAILLSLLGRRARWPAAFIGGIGFAFFIDELGKFITADNNYFFKPAAGLIYLVFISLFLISRAYQHHRGLTEAERVRNAIELLGEASIGRFRRAGAAIAAHYEAWTRQRWFHGAVVAVFAVWALAGVVAIVGLVLGGGGDSVAHLSFLNLASLGSTAVSSAFVLLGLGALLRGERLAAYTWLSRALLVSIFITRVFSFVESQFGAVLGLGVDIALLVSVQAMAGQDRRRMRSEAETGPIASKR